MIEIENMEPFPAGENPFRHDLYHMGTRLGTNCIVMHSNHPTEKAKYLIVVNIETGERARIGFEPRTPNAGDIIDMLMRNQ